MPVVIPQSEVILRSHFETGDKPTQDQFAEFIGTMFYLAQRAQDTADAALAVAALARARAPLVLVSATYPGSGADYNMDQRLNVDTVQASGSVGGDRVIRVSFTEALPSTAYVVLVTLFSSNQNWTQVQIVNKTIDYVEIKVPNPGQPINGMPIQKLMLAIFMEP